MTAMISVAVIVGTLLALSALLWIADLLESRLGERELPVYAPGVRGLVD